MESPSSHFNWSASIRYLCYLCFYLNCFFFVSYCSQLCNSFYMIRKATQIIFFIPTSHWRYCNNVPSPSFYHPFQKYSHRLYKIHGKFSYDLKILKNILLTHPKTWFNIDIENAFNVVGLSFTQRHLRHYSCIINQNVNGSDVVFYFCSGSFNCIKIRNVHLIRNKQIFAFYYTYVVQSIRT